MALYRPPDQYSRALDALRQRAVGVFDTGLRCICGNHNIMDHVTETSSRRTSSDRGVIGPGPDHHDRLEAFRVRHGYWCEGCGAVYHESVIEGVRGYKPLDLEAEREKIGKAGFDRFVEIQRIRQG